MTTIESTVEMVGQAYATMSQKLETVWRRLGRPLTLAEKILLSHLGRRRRARTWSLAESYLLLRPDRVALQDVTGQMAILQFMQAGEQEVSPRPPPSTATT